MAGVTVRPVDRTVVIRSGENTAEAARQAELARIAADRAAAAGQVTVADEVTMADASVTGMTVTIGNGVLTRFGSAPVPFTGSISLAPPATVTVVDAPYQLTFVNGRVGWPFMTARLPHANITGLVVKDAGSGALLAAGVDYIADLRFGALARASAGAARNVLVSYTASPERYDLIYLDPEFAAIGVVRGQPGVRDAAERLPTIGTKPGSDSLIDIRIGLFLARVTATSVSLVKVWNIRDGVAREFETQASVDRRRNRAAIRPLLDALERGQPTAWSAMGDSITALQSQQPSRTAPNGPYRDVATASGTESTYLREGIIDGALIDAVRSNYDNGDAAGATHTRFGRTWSLVGEAAQRGAGAVSYRNYSIAGTNSDDSTLGMTNPERLAAWATDGAECGIIATGMNDMDMGSTLFFNRIRRMIDAKYAAGALGVIVWGCSRPQAGAAPLAEWLRINRILRRAAETPGWGGRTAAFIDPMLVSHGPGVGALGLDPADLCLANGYNHPGIRQHEVEGGLGIRLIF